MSSSSSSGGRFRLGLCRLALAPLLALSSPAWAAEDPLRFELPVDCRVGETCTIQNYFDHDPGPGRKDYTCGQLSYDGHDGTDFRVPNLPAMAAGVAVVAAAPGTVLRVRDGMEDVSVREIGRAALEGRDAGNGVVIDHGDGWETQYSHLKNGSVSVEPGQRVSAGEPLGLIGLSGNTEFPHVHFSLRYRGEELDPFVGQAGFQDCAGPREPLWSERALSQLDYQATGLLGAGFAAGPIAAETAREGRFPTGSLDATAPALVFWADVFGVAEGDRQRIEILGPDGQAILDHESALESSKVIWFAYGGKKRKGARWPSGTYRGRYSLSRDGETVAAAERTIEVR